MGKFFSSLFASLSATARIVITFLLPVLKSEAGGLIAVALPIAEQIVMQMATGQLSGTAKRDAAVAGLGNALVSQGKFAAADLAVSTLNLVVEMAVARLKAPIF